MKTPEHWDAQYFRTKMLWPDFIRAVQADALIHAAGLCRSLLVGNANQDIRVAGMNVAKAIETEAEKLKAS